MLENFDQAKRELADVRNYLAKHRADESPNAETLFQKSRALDLLQDIYVDSKSTLDHVKEVFATSKIDDVLSIIDRALRVYPPFGRALSSEEDSRTVLALIDAAVWRSKFVWACGIAAITSILIALAMLGINVADLNKQAEAARKFFDDAKIQSQRSIDNMSEGVQKLKDQTAGFEKNKDAINARIDQINKVLDNSGSDVNKIIVRFTAELSRLGDLEREWSGQRATLAAALTQHDTFLVGKEAEVTQKTAEIYKRASDKLTAIDLAAESAKDQQQGIAGFAESSRANAAKISGLVGAAETDAANIQASKDKTAGIADTVATTDETIKKLQIESVKARDGIKDAEADVNKRIGDIKDLRPQDAINAELTKALSTLTSGKDAALSSVESSAKEANNSIAMSQKAAGQKLELINTTAEQVNGRSGEIDGKVREAGSLLTTIVNKLEDIKTEEARIKGERDRGTLELIEAERLIKLVEDKRTDVGEKLRTMLEEKPSLDAAAAWKLVLGSRVLLALGDAVAALLLALVLVLGALVRSRRDTRVHDPAPGKTP